MVREHVYEVALRECSLEVQSSLVIVIPPATRTHSRIHSLIHPSIYIRYYTLLVTVIAAKQTLEIYPHPQYYKLTPHPQYYKFTPHLQYYKLTHCFCCNIYSSLIPWQLY